MAGTYDLIWIQWVIGHLHDLDCITFFRYHFGVSVYCPYCVTFCVLSIDPTVYSRKEESTHCGFILVSLEFSIFRVHDLFFLYRRCAEGLTANGLIVLKDNVLLQVSK